MSLTTPPVYSGISSAGGMSLTTPPVYSGISSTGGMSLATPPVNSGNSFLGDSFGISDIGFSGFSIA